MQRNENEQMQDLLIKQELSPEEKYNIHRYFSTTLSYSHDGYISVAGAQSLVAALTTNTSLNTLEFNESYLEPTQLNLLMDMLRKNKTLQHFGIICDELDDNTHIPLIAKLLRGNCHPTQLDLFKSSITDAGLDLLCNALLDNTRLTKLYIDKNNFTDLQPIAKLIVRNRTLRSLHIGQDDGSKLSEDVIEALKLNTTLKKFSISGYDITETIKPLAELLRTNTSLTSLSIPFCSFRPSDGNLLLDSLRDNCTLRKLIIHYSDIDEDGLHYLEEILRLHNNTLTSICNVKDDLNDMRKKYPIVKTIEEHLERNRIHSVLRPADIFWARQTNSVASPFSRLSWGVIYLILSKCSDQYTLTNLNRVKESIERIISARTPSVAHLASAQKRQLFTHTREPKPNSDSIQDEASAKRAKSA